MIDDRPGTAWLERQSADPYLRSTAIVDWARADVEGAGGGAVDLGAGQVGGEEIRSELNPPEGQVKRLGQCANRSRFGQARHSFDQNMAAREQRNQQLFDRLLMTHDHLVNL